MQIEDIMKNTFDELIKNPLVNSFSVYSLFGILESPIQDEDIGEIERLCFSIVSNLYNNVPLIEMQNNDKQIVWYDYLKLQIYIFLSGQGSYSNDQALLIVTSSAVINTIASKVCDFCKINDSLIPLVATLILCAASKITVKAWCNHFYESRIKTNEKMLSILAKETKAISNDTGKV